MTTAAELEDRLAELTAQQADLRNRQGVIERELTSLRTDAVLGQLDEVDQQRMSSLKEQVAVIATDLREIGRLKKLVLQQIQTAHLNEAAARTDAESLRALKIQEAAKDKLPKLLTLLEDVASEYAACWALSQREPGERAASPDLIKNALRLNTHRPQVLESYTALRKELDNGA